MRMRPDCVAVCKRLLKAGMPIQVRLRVVLAPTCHPRVSRLL